MVPLPFKGHFTLWWRSPPVMNSRAILEFDWPRATLSSGGGLHYGQEFFGGEHCTWMKNDMDANVVDTCFEGEFSGGQISWATSKLRTRNLTYKELQLE